MMKHCPGLEPSIAQFRPRSFADCLRRRHLAARLEERSVVEAVRGHPDCRFLVMDRDPIRSRPESPNTQKMRVRSGNLAALAVTDSQHALAMSSMLLLRDPDAVIAAGRQRGSRVGVGSLTNIALAWRCLGERGRAVDVYGEIARRGSAETRLWSLLNAAVLATGTYRSDIRSTLAAEVACNPRKRHLALVKGASCLAGRRRDSGFQLGRLQDYDEQMLQLALDCTR